MHELKTTGLNNDEPQVQLFLEIRAETHIVNHESNSPEFPSTDP